MYKSAGEFDPRLACHVQISRWVWPKVSLPCTNQQVSLIKGWPVMYKSAGEFDPRLACHVQISRWVWSKVGLHCMYKSAGGFDQRLACHVQISRWVWPKFGLQCIHVQISRWVWPKFGLQCIHVQISRWVWPKVGLPCTNQLTPCSSSLRSCSAVLGPSVACFRQGRCTSPRATSSTSFTGTPRELLKRPEEGTASSRMDPRNVVSWNTSTTHQVWEKKTFKI